MNTKELILPAGALSATQLAKWERDKAAYFDQYFKGNTPPDNPSTLFGRRFADILETLHDTGEFPVDITDIELDVMKQLTFLDVAESEIVHDVRGVRCIARLDTRTEDWSEIVDYKTGHKPWTLERLQDSTQMALYALLTYRLSGLNPTVGIDWTETRQVEGTSIVEPTGRVEKFRHRFDSGYLDGFEKYIEAVARDIARHYAALRGDLPGWERGVLAEYINARRALRSAQKQADAAKRAYVEMMKACGIHRYESKAGTFYRYSRRAWEYPDDVVLLEQQVRQAQAQAQEDGRATCTEQDVFSFREKPS